MSTYWYLECISHDPPIRSDGEVSQHTDEYLDLARELWADRDRLATGDLYELLELMFPTCGYRSARSITSRDYFGSAALRFVVQHPRCQVQLRSEYDEVRAVRDA